jgi:spore coat polysaccharide biosynthesis predicted glycosyltransferase SpsG
VFVDAARELARPGDVAVVALVGARLAQDENLRAEPSPHLTMLDSVSNGILMGLMRDSALAVVNGGSLLLQALAQGVPIVAAPIAGDQLDRIRRCARAGYIREAVLQPAALTTSARALLQDTTERAKFVARLRGLGLRNGVATAVQAVERLLPGERA